MEDEFNYHANLVSRFVICDSMLNFLDVPLQVGELLGQLTI